MAWGAWAPFACAPQECIQFEYPTLGEKFRERDNGTNTSDNPGFAHAKEWLLSQIRLSDFILAQESDMVWVYREEGTWVFRVRRRIADDLQVFEFL